MFETTQALDASPAEQPAAPATVIHGSEWRTTEVALLRSTYPMGGASAVRALLPHRTLTSIRAKASSERIRCKKAPTEGRFFPRKYAQRDDIDNAIREGYVHATTRGFVKKLAAKIGRPAWWVQKRASSLGLTRTNRTRIDVWAAEELEIIERWAHCNLDVIAGKLREAGHPRTPTAVCVKLKRLQIDREDPDRWTATAVAPLLGVNPATVADWVERRGLPATREAWGPHGRLMIERARLRKWIARNPRYVDLRRVDQTWFAELMWGYTGGASA